MCNQRLKHSSGKPSQRVLWVGFRKWAALNLPQQWSIPFARRSGENLDLSHAHHVVLGIRTIKVVSLPLGGDFKFWRGGPRCGLGSGGSNGWQGTTEEDWSQRLAVSSLASDPGHVEEGTRWHGCEKFCLVDQKSGRNYTFLLSPFHYQRQVSKEQGRNTCFSFLVVEWWGGK